ncbi:MAG: hypothetical protein P8X96_02080 [Desulfobacteraceae bacterium]
MSGKIMMALDRLEADTLWSKGRLKEALKVYTRLLSSSPHMTLNTKLNLEARVRLLQGELDNPAPEDSGQAIDMAIKRLQYTLAEDQSIQDLRKGVRNFIDSARFADALENIKELIRQNAADEFCVSAAAECITKLHPIEDIPVAVDLLLVESFHNPEKAALFKMMLAKKMETKGYADQSRMLLHHEDRFISY